MWRTQSGGSPTFGDRSPYQRRRTNRSKESLTREEKVYKEIMGADGKVKPQFEHWLLELEIDSEDLLDL